MRLAQRSPLRGAKIAKFINEISWWESRLEKSESNPCGKWENLGTSPRGRAPLSALREWILW
jgi:hypothetical protein